MQHPQVGFVKCHSFIHGVSVEAVVLTVGLLSCWIGEHTEDTAMRRVL